MFFTSTVISLNRVLECPILGHCVKSSLPESTSWERSEKSQPQKELTVEWLLYCQSLRSCETMYLLFPTLRKNMPNAPNVLKNMEQNKSFPFIKCYACTHGYKPKNSLISALITGLKGKAYFVVCPPVGLSK